MIENVKPSLPIPHHSAQEFFKKPIVVLLALTALAALVGYAVRSLWGRIQIHPTPEKLYSDGMVAYKGREYHKAIKLFKWALDRNPHQELQTQIHVLRAQCYRSIKKFDKALKDYKAVEESPAHTDQQLLKVYAGRADIFSRQKEFQFAAAACYAALKFTKINSQKKASLLLINGFSLYSMEFYAQAIESFDEAEGLAPSDSNTLTQILYLRAKAYMKNDQPEKVLDGLKKASTLQQNVLNIPSVFIDVGQVYANLGEESRAMECYHLALECVPLPQTDQANVLYHRGCLQRDKKEPNFKSALADFRQASGLDEKVQPDLESNIYWMSGLLCIEQENYKIGIEQLTKAIESKPIKTHLPDILLSLGLAFFTEKNCKEAIKSYSKAINLGIEGEALATALFHRSKVYLSLKQFSLAQLDCEDALKCTFEDKDFRQELLGYQQTLKKLS